MPLNLPPGVAEALTEPIAPAAQVGAVTGFIGACLGGAVGVLQSAHPGMITAVSGAQFFVLGGGFLYTRQICLTLSAERTIDHRRRELLASAFAGTLSGAAAGRFWSRPTSIAGAICFGTIGYFGQRSIHKSADKPRVERDRRTLLQKVADSKWSPIKSLSNEDYEKMLTEKLYKVEAEITVIDEKLSDLKQMQKTQTDGL